MFLRYRLQYKSLRPVMPMSELVRSKLLCNPPLEPLVTQAGTENQHAKALSEPLPENTAELNISSS